MEKSTILLLCCSLIGIFSCGKEDDLQKAEFNQDTIESLKKGYSLVTEVEEISPTGTNQYIHYAKSNSLGFSTKITDLNEKTIQFETYLKKENDQKVYATRLGVNNEVEYIPLYNGQSGAYFSWTDGYDNLFNKLSIESFETSDNINFLLKNELLLESSEYLSTSLYGNPGLNFESFSFELNENGSLKYSAEATYKLSSSSSYSYLFSGEIVESGEDVKLDYLASKFDEINDNNFSTMVSKLKEGNYTATAVNYQNNREISSNFFKSNSDAVYYETSSYGESYKVGYYLNDDGLIQEVKNVDGLFYKVDSPMEGKIEDVQPSFNIAREVFNFDNGIYTLKNNIDGDMFSIYYLEVDVDTLSNFTIQINSDNYIFTNINGNKKTVITFSDIGSTDVGFSKDTVLDEENEENLTWEGVLSKEDYDFTWEQVGSYLEENGIFSLTDILPVPSNNNSRVNFSEEEGYAMLVADTDKIDIDEDISSYNLILINDYGYEETEGLNGGNGFLMDDLYIETLNYDGLFTIFIGLYSALNS